MAMAYTFRVLENGARNYVLQVNGIDTASTTAATQDGTSTGIIAANGYTPTVHFKVNRVLYNTANNIVQLQWHATTNVAMVTLSGFGDWNYDEMAGKSVQGMWDDGGAGVTGDIDIANTAVSTVTGVPPGVAASFSLTLFCTKGVSFP